MSINNRDKFPWDMWLFQILGWFWHKDGYINKQSNENKHKFAIGIVLIQGSRCYSEDLNTRSFLWTPTSFNTFNTTYKLLHPITPSLYIISDTSFLHTDQLQYHYYTATPYSFLVSLLHTDQLQYTYYIHPIPSLNIISAQRPTSTTHSILVYHFSEHRPTSIPSIPHTNCYTP